MKHYAKLVIALFAILCPTAGFAQKDYAAEKALITKVKRSPGTYVYAEATCRTEEEAKSIAEDVFLQNINEYVASQKKLRGANNIVVNNQKGLQQTVTMPRGSNMHRVFMYVKKNDIIPADNSVVLSKEEVAKTETPAPKANTKTEAKVAAPTADVTTPKADVAEVKAKSAQPKTEVAQPKTEVAEAKAEPKAEPKAEVKAETKATTTEVAASTLDKIIPEKPQAIPEAAKKMATFTNVKTAAVWLKDMKANGTVTEYNKYNAVADKEAYWLVIYDSHGDIAAVLTDGKQRRNAATQKPDHERNYPNCAALCVKFANK
ncbi:hypothetical protein [Prevotella sp.]|uniref:hypothetical protein n=1 Tax=Prevotella sp. TaxID=59823 RepID=UPI002E77CF9D|nr:hypothetical protein [Prevotella sp.]MEE0669161.1 hypothetical protein [Prevotella sp.]